MCLLDALFLSEIFFQSLVIFIRLLLIIIRFPHQHVPPTAATPFSPPPPPTGYLQLSSIILLKVSPHYMTYDTEFRLNVFVVVTISLVSLGFPKGSPPGTRVLVEVVVEDLF